MNQMMGRHNGRAWRAAREESLSPLLGAFFGPWQTPDDVPTPGPMPIDVTERKEDYVVRAEIPGVRREDVDVTIADGVLTITAVRKTEITEKEGEVVLREERTRGESRRSLKLGTDVNEERIEARYQDGILELVLPKAEAAKPRKITIG